MDITPLINDYDRAKDLSRASLNGFVYELCTFLKKGADLAKGTPTASDPYGGTIMIPVSQTFHPELIIDMVKAWIPLSAKLVLFIENDFHLYHIISHGRNEGSYWGYHLSSPEEDFFQQWHPEPGDKNTPEVHHYFPWGSLKVSWICELLRYLKPAIEKDKVIIVPAYLSSIQVDEIDPWSPLFTKWKDVRSFESFGMEARALGILREGSELRRTVEKDPHGKKIEWELVPDFQQYWTLLFKEIGFPYISNVGLVDVIHFGEEAELFEIFQKRIARNLRSVESLDKERAIQDLVEETKEGFVEIREKFERKLCHAKFLGGVSTLTFALSCGIFASSNLEFFKLLSAVLGGGTITTLFDKVSKILEVRSDMKLHKFYIPYRLMKPVEMVKRND